MSTIGTLLKRGAGGGEWDYNVNGIMAHGYVNQSFGLTRWYSPNGGGTEIATEDGIRIPIAGTVSRLFVNVGSNTLNGNAVITVRLQKANTLLAVTVGAGITGVLSNVVNIPVVAANDELTVSVDTTAAGAGAIVGGFAFIFTSTIAGADTTKTYSCSLSVCNDNTIAVNFGLTRFSSPSGAFGNAAEFSIPMPIAGTLKKMLVRVGDTNTLDNNCVVRTRRNAANGNQIITIPTLIVDVFFQDNVNTDVCAVGDRMAWSIVTTAAGAGSILIISISCVFEVT